MARDEYATFGELRARLDEIVVEVRNKDTSLERSLDLYEEAIKLGNRCAELVDKPDYTDEEARAAHEAMDEAAPAVAISGEAAEPAEQATADEAPAPELDSAAVPHDAS